MPLDYDFTYRYDEESSKITEGEPTYRDVLPWHASHALETAVLRYERRLKRPLTPDEGQVLMYALGVRHAFATPRFVRCRDCGEWIDQGRLGDRPDQPLTTCENCDIPF